MGLFVHKRIISAVKRVKSVSDRMSYIILRASSCDIIVLNVHAPTEDKIDMNRIHKELECVFNKFPKYHMKILLGDFNAKVRWKTLSNQQSGMRVCTKLVMITELE
jgi:hypothetical protein